MNTEIALPSDDSTFQGKSLWRNVTKIVPEMQKFVTYKVNSGKNIWFWHDHWVDRGCIKDLFPAISKVCRNKQATIAEMIIDGRWEGNFKRSLNQNERMEWDLLKRDLGNPHILLEAEEEVMFEENFSPKTCYSALKTSVEECSYKNRIWLKEVPNKVSFLLWAALNNSIPTRTMLLQRGMQLDSDWCVLCNGERETTDNLLIHCSFSFQVWDYFIKSFHISWPLPSNILQLFISWNWNVLKGRCKTL